MYIQYVIYTVSAFAYTMYMNNFELLFGYIINLHAMNTVYVAYVYSTFFDM